MIADDVITGWIEHVTQLETDLRQQAADAMGKSGEGIVVLEFYAAAIAAADRTKAVKGALTRALEEKDEQRRSELLMELFPPAS